MNLFNFKSVFDLEIPFSLKDKAKSMGCRWNCNNWYFEDKEGDLFQNDIPTEHDIFIKHYKRVDLKSSFEDKEEIKSNGGRWDKHNKVWCTYTGNTALSKFFDFKDAWGHSVEKTPEDDSDEDILKLVSKKKTKKIPQL